MIKRTSHRLLHDPSRVIAKPYLPGEEIAPVTGTRAGLLMARILAIPEAEVGPVLEQTLASFGRRHRRFEELLERHFALVAHHAGDVAAVARAPAPDRRLLHQRVLGRGGGAVQSLRSCPRPIRPEPVPASGDS